MWKIRFEFFKICSPKPLISLALIFAAALYFLFTGISEYKSTIKDLEFDVEMEYRKSNFFVTYDQYSIIGYRVLFRPSPLVVFFSNSIVVQDLESNIDTSEVVKIYNNANGKSILKKWGNFRDFGGILDIFGSLFMITMGALTLKNMKPLFAGDKKFFPVVLPRLAILDCFFILLVVIAYLTAVFSGIDFSGKDLRQYTIFAGYTLLFLNFFFFSGLLFSRLFKGKRGGLLAAVTVWAMISLITPEIRYITAWSGDIPSVKEINFKKMSNLMKAEKKIREQILPLLQDKNRDIQEIRKRQRELAEKYMDEGHRENKAMEDRLHKKVKARIKGYENISASFPSLFYMSLLESLSGKGFNDYIGFKEFVLDMREGFFTYIFKKRYAAGYKKVEPYIKKGENVYRSGAALPGNFLMGTVSVLVYSLAALLASFLLFRRKIHGPRAEKGNNTAQNNFFINPDLLSGAKSFFLYCKDEYRAHGYLDDLKKKEEVCVVENVRLPDYGPGASLVRWIRYMCGNIPSPGSAQESKAVKIKEALDILNQLGVSGKDLDKRGPSIPGESFKKVYLVLKLCEKKSLITLFDFFKGETREFELECKKVLEQIPGRIFYISTIPLTRIESPDTESDDEETKIVAVDLFDKSITLR